MNAQEFQVLQGLSAGVDNTSQNQAPVVIAQSNPIAPLTPAIQPTNPTVNISPEAMVGNVCGMFALEIDTTTEGALPSQLVLGGMANSGDPAYNALLLQLLGLSGVPTINQTPGLVWPSRNNTPATALAFLQWFNSYLCCNPMIVGPIAVTDMGSTVPGAFATFRKSALRIASVSPSGNFSQANYALKPDLCNPCFNSSDDIGLWEGKFPLSSSTALAINVPVGLRVQMEFSVIGTANTGAFASC